MSKGRVGGIYLFIHGIVHSLRGMGEPVGGENPPLPPPGRANVKLLILCFIYSIIYLFSFYKTSL